jgi:hypothetical protein
MLMRWYSNAGRKEMVYARRRWTRAATSDPGNRASYLRMALDNRSWGYTRRTQGALVYHLPPLQVVAYGMHSAGRSGRYDDGWDR